MTGLFEHVERDTNSIHKTVERCCDELGYSMHERAEVSEKVPIVDPNWAFLGTLIVHRRIEKHLLEGKRNYIEAVSDHMDKKSLNHGSYMCTRIISTQNLGLEESVRGPEAITTPRGQPLTFGVKVPCGLIYADKLSNALDNGIILKWQGLYYMAERHVINAAQKKNVLVAYVLCQ